ncbi:ATP-dependent DNA helicase [Ideonella sp. B7]|uniref:ATP-dependent DNA helicase n=1 Tax=Ideonella benzenivorans TaxID=2831643 RepID=UPI001CED9C4A|nr:ATP-dependent DNA helicase [Ideonella benzenivorans]MCA6217584.1 ATP-dependent DNA helicase [Ideonella benzenivorans]
MSDAVSSAPADLVAAVQAALSVEGPLALADVGFLPRAAQTDLATAVAETIERREALVAEAGTGVGKTYAYLLPVLLSGRRTLVSTATKSLQDQLFFRDLPRLRDLLKLPVTVALLKGRASYLCRHRLVQAREGAVLPDRFAVRALARIESWAQATTSGDISELEGLDERSEVIPLVTSTRDNCLGSECGEYHACHVMKARREAMAADVVVVNHHLFFADLALRDSGVAELLPTVDIAVFDEAHQMVEAGVQFLGQTLGTGQVTDFAQDLLAAGLQQARGQAPWAELSTGCEQAARELRLVVAGAHHEVRGVLRLRWDEVAGGGRAARLAQGLETLAERLRAAGAALELVAGSSPDFAKLQARAQGLLGQVARFGQETPPERVRWVDLTPHQARLIESPLDIRSMMGEQRAQGHRAWVFTSATLGDDADLSWFSEAAGLDDARKLRVGSPFDYPHHARVYVPPRFPQPNEPAHPVMVGRASAHCAHALGGRTFVLTTTLRAMRTVAEALTGELKALGSTLEVLVQGTAAKRSLLQRFQEGGCVLVGSHSFWEGIDVPGQALQCVVIDKLPFPPPNDPLVEARVRQLKSQGRDAFNDYFVAEAAIALKQGAGRLIRTETDHGLLVLCDVRLLQARYGARLLAALPPMAMLSSGEQALSWLRELAAAHTAG